MSPIKETYQSPNGILKLFIMGTSCNKRPGNNEEYLFILSLCCNKLKRKNLMVRSLINIMRKAKQINKYI